MSELTKPIKFRGQRRAGSAIVEFQGVDGGPWLPLPLRLDIYAHSPGGFEWGYAGSGPAQLALAILAAHRNHLVAQRFHQAFKARVIAQIDTDEWTLDGDFIDNVVLQLRKAEAAEEREVAHWQG